MNFKLYIIFLFFSTNLFSQKLVETKIDVTKNKIGAQFNLTLKTEVDTLSQVTFPKGKNFGKLEVIRDYVIDTIKKGSRYELIKKYGLTQFDSGKYYVPSLRVLIDKKMFLTDSILVEVANVQVDTLRQKNVRYQTYCRSFIKQKLDLESTTHFITNCRNWCFCLLVCQNPTT